MRDPRAWRAAVPGNVGEGRHEQPHGHEHPEHAGHRTADRVDPLEAGPADADPQAVADDQADGLAEERAGQEQPEADEGELGPAGRALRGPGHHGQEPGGEHHADGAARPTTAPG